MAQLAAARLPVELGGHFLCDRSVQKETGSHSRRGMLWRGAMMDEAKLLEKLRLIEALFEGAATVNPQLCRGGSQGLTVPARAVFVRAQVRAQGLRADLGASTNTPNAHAHDRNRMGACVLRFTGIG